jgi:hypothetical protein
MHGPINVKSPNNISKWQMGFNSAFKGLRSFTIFLILFQFFSNFLALLVFYVPSESGEKVTLGISALLSMTVFLMTIRESLPPTEKTPLISEFNK